MLVIPAGHLGDVSVTNSAFRFLFNTEQANGTPITLAGSPTLVVYNNSLPTEDTDSVSLNVGFDGTTGLHQAVVEISDNPTFYDPNTEYSVVLKTGTVDGVSVVGKKVASFSVDRDGGTLLRPTGLDSLVATSPTALATSFKDKVLQVWDRFFGRVEHAQGTTETIKTQTSGGTAVTTQTVTKSGTTTTLGAAS